MFQLNEPQVVTVVVSGSDDCPAHNVPKRIWICASNPEPVTDGGGPTSDISIPLHPHHSPQARYLLYVEIQIIFGTVSEFLNSVQYVPYLCGGLFFFGLLSLV